MSTYRNQSAFLLSFLIGIITIACWVGVSITVFWINGDWVINAQQIAFLGQGILLMMLGFAWFSQVTSVPLSSRTAVIITATTGIMLVFVLELAIFRSYYSRLSLLSFPVIFAAGTLFLNGLTQRYAQTHVGLLNSANCIEWVKDRTQYSFRDVSDLEYNVARLDVLVVDFDQPLSQAEQDYVSRAVVHSVHVLRDTSFKEHVSGRMQYENARHIFNVAPAQLSMYTQIKVVWETLLVAVTSPLWLPLVAVVWCAVKLDSPGTGFFVQRRVGLAGRHFNAIKLRTMRADIDNKATGQDAQFASPNDARITRLGHFLRKTRIDEVPQFFNILRGEMALIGPRPEQVPFSEEFERTIPFYALRYNVKPGISGWAQVIQGYTGDEDETRLKLEYDLYYVRNISFQLDCLIVLRTISTIFTGFGAR